MGPYWVGRSSVRSIRQLEALATRTEETGAARPRSSACGGAGIRTQGDPKASAVFKMESAAARSGTELHSFPKGCMARHLNARRCIGLGVAWGTAGGQAVVE